MAPCRSRSVASCSARRGARHQLLIEVGLPPVSKANKPPANTTLRDFADLKRALSKAAKEAAASVEKEKAARAHRAITQKSQEADSALFKRTVGRVHALPDITHAHTNAQVCPIASRATVLRSQVAPQAPPCEALSDEFNVDALLETDETLSWRSPELGIDVVRKLRRGVWAAQGVLDLHGLRVDEARERVSRSLLEAQLKGWRCLHVVHGKGLSSPGKQPVLQDKVRSWLVQSERVLAFVQARVEDGGMGALVVLIKAGKHPPIEPH